MPKPSKISRESISRVNTLNVMERKEVVGVSITQRPAQRPCTEPSLRSGAWDAKDKDKWRTLEEYFKFMSNAGRPPEDGEKKTEALPVMVEMPPPNPNPGGGNDIPRRSNIGNVYDVSTVDW